MTLTVKNVKFGIKVGDSVPAQDPNNLGNVGQYIEQTLKKNGINLSKKGIDIPQLKMEVKTRNDDAESPFTICRMSLEQIINNDYKNSKVFQSIENLLIIRYNNILNTITSIEVHHWNNWDLINEILRTSYDQARNMLIAGHDFYSYPSVRGDVGKKKCAGYFEHVIKKSGREEFHFRLGKGDLENLEKMKNMPAIKLFELLE